MFESLGLFIEHILILYSGNYNIIKGVHRYGGNNLIQQDFVHCEYNAFHLLFIVCRLWRAIYLCSRKYILLI